MSASTTQSSTNNSRVLANRRFASGHELCCAPSPSPRSLEPGRGDVLEVEVTACDFGCHGAFPIPRIRSRITQHHHSRLRTPYLAEECAESVVVVADARRLANGD